MAIQTSKTQTALSEINVTPLVDVMLVLLIVFMISAPLMQQGIQVDLPKANAPTMNDIPDQLVLVVDKSKNVIMNGNRIPEGTLRTRLEAIAKAKPEIQVFIQGDANVPYGTIAQVMAEVKQARITRVGLVTEPGDPNARL
ncbi:MAG: biopolymer transporter ExbD [Bdellovibrionales bacterium]|nr:biopolymer transporter ExbD [Bdellovibrionales bacterium]